MLARLGPLTDPRLQEALDMLEAKRLPDGHWQSDGWYLQSPGTRGLHVAVVYWGRRGPNAMLTLNALRVLKAAGRLTT